MRTTSRYPGVSELKDQIFRIGHDVARIGLSADIDEVLRRFATSNNIDPKNSPTQTYELRQPG
jgi:hypothetical protein